MQEHKCWYAQFPSWSNIFWFVCLHVWFHAFSWKIQQWERESLQYWRFRSQFEQSIVTQIFRSTKCLEGDGSYSSFPHAHAGETNVPHTLHDETIVEQLKVYSIVLRFQARIFSKTTSSVLFVRNVCDVSLEPYSQNEMLSFFRMCFVYPEYVFLLWCIQVKQRLCLWLWWSRTKDSVNLSHLNYQLAD